MGITTNTLQLLLQTRNWGIDFRKTATIGRQMFWHCDPLACNRLVSGLASTAGNALSFADGAYADDLFRLLGAEALDSFDANHYEQATQIHDFNYPIPEKFCNAYSVVYDGGSLEHIFNTPCAIRNEMSMVALNGHLISAVPCNNWGGHGFYQFNPEFFYRVLSEENGFSNTRVILYTETGDFQTFDAPDPMKLGRRNEFASQVQLTLFVISQKVSTTEIFRNYPQQSDYELKTWVSS